MRFSDKVAFIRCDVANDVEVDAAVAATVERFGGIDILVNNAGEHRSRWSTSSYTTISSSTASGSWTTS